MNLPEYIPHDSLSISISCIWCKCIVTLACHRYTMIITHRHNSRVVQSKEVTQNGVNLPLVTSSAKIDVVPEIERQ
jgi:hypothetical protein